MRLFVVIYSLARSSVLRVLHVAPPARILVQHKTCSISPHSSSTNNSTSTLSSIKSSQLFVKYLLRTHPVDLFIGLVQKPSSIIDHRSKALQPEPFKPFHRSCPRLLLPIFHQPKALRPDLFFSVPTQNVSAFEPKLGPFRQLTSTLS